MKEIIVGIYDGCYQLSIEIDGKVFYIDEYYDCKTPDYFNEIFKIVLHNDYNCHHVLHEKYPNTRIIVCTDGCIEDTEIK